MLNPICFNGIPHYNRELIKERRGISSYQKRTSTPLLVALSVVEPSIHSPRYAWIPFIGVEHENSHGFERNSTIHATQFIPHAFSSFLGIFLKASDCLHMDLISKFIFVVICPIGWERESNLGLVHHFCAPPTLLFSETQALSLHLLYTCHTQQLWIHPKIVL